MLQSRVRGVKMEAVCNANYRIEFFGNFVLRLLLKQSESNPYFLGWHLNRSPSRNSTVILMLKCAHWIAYHIKFCGWAPHLPSRFNKPAWQFSVVIRPTSPLSKATATSVWVIFTWKEFQEFSFCLRHNKSEMEVLLIKFSRSSSAADIASVSRPFSCLGRIISTPAQFRVQANCRSIWPAFCFKIAINLTL